MTATLPLAVSAAAGLVVWTVTSVVTGHAEPWDSPVYWQASYPAAIVLAGGLGFAFPNRAWRWAAVLMGMQLPVMLAGSPGLGLLPLGVLMLAVLALPAVAAAWLGAQMRT